MQDQLMQLSIDDIEDIGGGASLFGLDDGGTLDISLMDIVIAVISHR